MRIAAAVGLSAILLTQVAWAEDFVVNTATTVTNGSAANGNDGSDTLTITPTGSIATGSTLAVLADGSGNVIDNRGRLSTSQDDAIVLLLNDAGNTIAKRFGHVPGRMGDRDPHQQRKPDDHPLGLRRNFRTECSGY